MTENNEPLPNTDVTYVDQSGVERHVTTDSHGVAPIPAHSTLREVHLRSAAIKVEAPVDSTEGVKLVVNPATGSLVQVRDYTATPPTLLAYLWLYLLTIVPLGIWVVLRLVYKSRRPLSVNREDTGA